MQSNEARWPAADLAFFGAQMNPASNDRLNASAVMGATGCEKSTAARLFHTAITLRHEPVFPVGNGLRRVRPDRAGKETARQIINRYVDVARDQYLHRLGEVVLIVQRVDPQ